MSQHINPQDSPYLKTWKRVKQCVCEVRTEDRQNREDELSSQEGVVARLKEFLFYPLESSFFVVAGSLFIGLLIVLFTCVLANEAQEIRQWINLIAFILLIVLYVVVLLAVNFLTPKSNLNWDDRWSKVLKKYKEKFSLPSDKLERELKRAISHYKRESEPLGFIVNLLWGGIVIGCLPDPNFQSALMTLSIEKTVSTNSFGGISILVLLFLFFWHIKFHLIPIAWMENIVSQLELGESES